MPSKRNFAVIGLGAFGASICDVLIEKGATVVAMDRDSGTVEQMKSRVSAAVLVDTTNEESLLKAPLEDIDVAIVAIGDNLEASILTTMLLKQRGVPYVVARAVSPLHDTVLRRVGANETVNIEVETGTRVARRLVALDVLDSIPLSSKVSLAEQVVPDYFIGKALGDLDIEKKMKVRLVGVLRLSLDLDDTGNSVRRETLIFPDSKDSLEEGDRLFLLGENKNLDAFQQL
ncbi:MAG TPA: TrkA family potassium uptake protein [Spirochaetaceae bacterium]|jgi:trk system potassium uptake protein TrkA|nr:TrkA family potassium uptake protein [Spirochaetaceae bacterium]